MKSKRNKKREIQQGVAKLRAKAGWNPLQNQESQEEIRQRLHQDLEELGQSERNSQAYTTNNVCPKCRAVRQDSQDPTALCDAHLKQVLGF